MANVITSYFVSEMTYNVTSETLNTTIPYIGVNFWLLGLSPPPFQTPRLSGF